MARENPLRRTETGPALAIDAAPSRPDGPSRCGELPHGAERLVLGARRTIQGGAAERRRHCYRHRNPPQMRHSAANNAGSAAECRWSHQFRHRVSSGNPELTPSVAEQSPARWARLYDQPKRWFTGTESDIRRQNPRPGRHSAQESTPNVTLGGEQRRLRRRVSRDPPIPASSVVWEPGIDAECRLTVPDRVGPPL
jgi:hypothetical protein